jgi:serine/threonine-protein kinase
MVKKPNQPQGRYELREVLGEGGMGVVYRAFDPVLKRDVTLKTIRDAQDPAVLELFKRECAVLASMGHPNIVEIFDIGEIEEGGQRRPYFVMPLLKGVTLDSLIRSASPRLSVERSVQMIVQMCRGLQAAHDQGLVHRDLKPANIFVLEDDSIKIIDFGVAHLVDTYSVTGLKGTVLYMAPEQLQMKRPTPVSDQFSLAVISYEMLTRRHPFHVPGQEDLAQLILNYSPPPVSDINASAPPLISQVIHKALSKEPFNRFANLREYGEYLQKAVRNEPIEIFDPSRVEPRLLRARTAFDEGDWDFAAEIIRELKSESYLNPEIERLEKEITDAARNRSVKQLLETARRRFDENEHILALQKVQEVINLDPANLDALTLKNRIESKRSVSQVEEWFRLAQQHLDNRAYGHARQAIEKLLATRPNDARAQAFLGEIDRQETDYSRLRAEKQQAYEAAMDAYKRGDVKSALTKLERCLEADRHSSGNSSSDQTNAYQKLYDEVRSKRDQMDSQEAEVRKHLTDGRYDDALAICHQVLKQYPTNVLFGVFRDDAEQGQRRETSAFVAKVEKDVADEADLNRKVAILEEAQRKYPSEPRFEQSLKQVRARKDLVDTIVSRAQALEESGHFPDALAQWETLSNIYPLYPGLKVEIERVTRRRQQQAQTSVKASWVAQVDQAVNIHNFVRAAGLIQEALQEFPADVELLALEDTIAQLSNRQSEVQGQLAKAKELDAAGKTTDGIELLRSVFKAEPHQQPVRSALLDLLLKQAGTLLDTNWAGAEPFVAEAIAIEPQNTLAKSLRTLIADKQQGEEVERTLSSARSLQGQGKSRDAIRELDLGLSKHPRETRLIQLRASLGHSLSTEEREDLRAQDLQELRKLEEASSTVTDARSLDTIFDRTQLFRTKYADDNDFNATLAVIEKRVTNKGGDPKKVTDSKKSGDAKKGGEPKAEPQPAIDAAPAPSAAGPVWKTASVQVLYGLGGAVVAGLVIYFAIASLRTQPPPAVTLQPVPVAVLNLEPGMRIEDGKGEDLMAAAADPGLMPGNYHLKGSRAGFAPMDVTFTVGAGETQHEVSAVWLPLPVRLVIRSTLPSQATLDGQPIPADGNTLIANLTNGAHHLEWSSDRFATKMDLEVTNGVVTKNNWEVQRGLPAFFATMGPATISYESQNMGAKILKNNSELVPAAGTLDLPAGDETMILNARTSDRLPLAEFQRLDAAYSGSVSLTLVPTAPGRVNAKPSAPVSAQSPITSAMPTQGATQLPTPAAVPAQAAPPSESALDRLKKRAGSTK